MKDNSSPESAATNVGGSPKSEVAEKVCVPQSGEVLDSAPMISGPIQVEVNLPQVEKRFFNHSICWGAVSVGLVGILVSWIFQHNQTKATEAASARQITAMEATSKRQTAHQMIALSLGIITKSRAKNEDGSFVEYSKEDIAVRTYAVSILAKFSEDYVEIPEPAKKAMIGGDLSTLPSDFRTGFAYGAIDFGSDFGATDYNYNFSDKKTSKARKKEGDTDASHSPKDNGEKSESN